VIIKIMRLKNMWQKRTEFNLFRKKAMRLSSISWEQSGALRACGMDRRLKKTWEKAERD
jgi:hypothetical protein